MKQIGIYKITSPSNKVYIGQSRNIERRRKEYSQKGCPKQRKLFSSLVKYGWDTHKFEVLMNVSENVPQNIFDDIEQAYMDFYRNSGYELMNIKEGGSNGPHSEETRKRMSLKKIGRKLSESTLKKHRERMLGKNNPFYNKKHSEETRKKMRDNHHKLAGGTHPNAVKALQFTKSGELIKEWESIADAVRSTHISNISACCSGVKKSAGNFIWRYKDDNSN